MWNPIYLQMKPPCHPSHRRRFNFCSTVSGDVALGNKSLVAREKTKQEMESWGGGDFQRKTVTLEAVFVLRLAEELHKYQPLKVMSITANGIKLLSWYVLFFMVIFSWFAPLLLPLLSLFFCGIFWILDFCWLNLVFLQSCIWVLPLFVTTIM